MDVAETDGLATFAVEIAPRMGLTPGLAVDPLIGWDLQDEDHAEELGRLSSRCSCTIPHRDEILNS